MRVCIVIRSVQVHNKGGIEDHVMTLANGLAKKKCDVMILTTGHPKGIEKEKKSDIEIIYLKGTRPGYYSKEWWKKSHAWFEKNNDFDIVHTQSSGAYSILPLCKKYKIPIIMSFHGTAWDELVTNIKIRKYLAPALLSTFLYRHYSKEKPNVAKMDGIIATSNEQHAMLKWLYRLPKERLFLVYNGIDAKVFKPTKTDSSGILCISRLIMQKGIQNMIKAMPLILENRDAKLTVVGDGPFRKKLELLKEKVGANKNISFYGYADPRSLPKLFNTHEIFVNPTVQQNGYDLTIIEAMACEKPVVVSNLGSVPTVVNSGNGILVKPGNAKEIASAVIKLFSDKALAKKLGKQGRKDVMKKFTDKKMVEDTINVYKEVISRRTYKSS